MTDEGLGGVAVHVANDGPSRSPRPCGSPSIATSSAASGRRRPSSTSAPTTRRRLDLETVLGRFVDASWAYRFGPPAQSVITASLEGGDGADPTLASAAFFPAGMPTERRTAAQMGLRAEVVAVDGTSTVVRLETDRFLFGLTLLSTASVVENPPSFLQPGRPRDVTLRSIGPVDARPAVAVTALNLREKLTVPLEGG